MKVSIHALLAECDLHYHITLNYVQRFNPRTPCGVRLLALLQVSRLTRFQSTHSLRSATGFAVLHGSCDHSFNPRTPCGVRHGALILNTCQCCFNPRTPCGVRQERKMRFYGHGRFQSTHSLRSATGAVNPHWSRPRVSIHALLAECDGGQHVLPACFSGFNPRTPCGVRLRPTLYIATQQSKSYFAPTSLKRPSLHGCSF